MARGRDQHVEALVDRFIRMLPGQSFFVADVTSRDMNFMRRPVAEAGCGIKMVQVEVDEIYQVSGVRVWREEGAYDEL